VGNGGTSTDYVEESGSEKSPKRVEKATTKKRALETIEHQTAHFESQSHNFDRRQYVDSGGEGLRNYIELLPIQGTRND